MSENLERMDAKDEDLTDPYCDPENPQVVPFQEVSAAAYKIKSGIERTPCTVCPNRQKHSLNVTNFFRNHIYQPQLA